jgi:hypothetical protein
LPFLFLPRHSRLAPVVWVVTAIVPTTFSLSASARTAAITGNRGKLRGLAGDERAHPESLLNLDAVLAGEAIDLGLGQLDQDL